MNHSEELQTFLRKQAPDLSEEKSQELAKVLLELAGFLVKVRREKVSRTKNSEVKAGD